MSPCIDFATNNIRETINRLSSYVIDYETELLQYKKVSIVWLGFIQHMQGMNCPSAAFHQYIYCIPDILTPTLDLLQIIPQQSLTSLYIYISNEYTFTTWWPPTTSNVINVSQGSAQTYLERKKPIYTDERFNRKKRNLKYDIPHMPQKCSNCQTIQLKEWAIISKQFH